MLLKPDFNKIALDPFAAQPTVKIFCDVYDPTTGKPYTRCPRSIAKAASLRQIHGGFGDTAFFGPEAEFFVFDDVKYSVKPNKVGFRDR